MDFDITIVGGGLIGNSLACALKGQGFKIALIDKNNSTSVPKNIPGNIEEEVSQNLGNSKALALSYSSIEFLKSIDLLEELNPFAEPMVEVHVSKEGYWGITRLTSKQVGLEKLGFVINAEVLNDRLFKKAQLLKEVSFFLGDTVLKVDKHAVPSGIEVELNSKKKFSTALLIAAEGTNSFLRNEFGIETLVKDHQQTALVVSITLNQSHRNIAYERFLKEGTIAVLPVSLEKIKVVLILSTEKIHQLLTFSNTDLLKVIQNYFGYQLGVFKSLETRHIFPLKTTLSKALYDKRLVLIGNAANTLHPVAAQGFNLGVRDVAFLTENLVKAKANEEDFGSVENLRYYASQRMRDHHTIQAWTDQFTSPSILQWLGILGCEQFSTLKKWVSKKGLGTYLSLPKLCRGVLLNEE